MMLDKEKIELISQMDEEIQRVFIRLIYWKTFLEFMCENKMQKD